MNSRAVEQSGAGVRLVPPVRRLLNDHLAMVGRMRLDYGDAVRAADSLLWRYGFYVKEWPSFFSSDLFHFNLDLFSLEGVPVSNSMLVVDGYQGKVEVAYLS